MACPGSEALHDGHDAGEMVAWNVCAVGILDEEVGEEADQVGKEGY